MAMERNGHFKARNRNLCTNTGDSLDGSTRLRHFLINFAYPAPSPAGISWKGNGLGGGTGANLDYTGDYGQPGGDSYDVEEIVLERQVARVRVDIGRIRLLRIGRETLLLLAGHTTISRG